MYTQRRTPAPKSAATATAATATTAAATAVAAVLLAACGTSTTADGGKGTDKDPAAGTTAGTLTDTRWTIRTLTVADTPHPAPEGTHLTFDDKSQVSGNYGCNDFRARTDLKGGVLTLKDAVSTETACTSLDFEERLARTLAAGGLTVTREKDTLRLTTPKGDHVELTRAKAEEPAPLTGTRWTVTTLTDGTTSASLPAGTEGKAHLTIAKDGRASGNLGCNRFSATAKIGDDGTLTLGTPAMTRMMCAPAAMRTEKALLRLFDGKKITYELSGDSLTLTAPDGKGATATVTPRARP
ncbi:META domain-containing protein [Streptomyces uncialis]|uniref:META domain-containing protein n=1 Tax=Streptomyces uncialis TaxID=1048205 RepID=UPI0038653318|nr:META domain-containing protein [Streptomyces uncialis]